MDNPLPAIPAKRYFTIGEVSDLCGVKPYVLRYWEQEFTQLKPMKRRGNRRYYQHHEVLLIRRIRDLLYDQGFTISGARNQLGDGLPSERPGAAAEFLAEAQLAVAAELEAAMDAAAEARAEEADQHHPAMALRAPGATTSLPLPITGLSAGTLEQIRAELLAIRSTLLS